MALQLTTWALEELPHPFFVADMCLGEGYVGDDSVRIHATTDCSMLPQVPLETTIAERLADQVQPAGACVSPQCKAAAPDAYDWHAKAQQRIAETKYVLTPSGMTPANGLTLHNVPAEYAARRIFDGLLLADPDHWGYQPLPEGNPFNAWTGAVCRLLLHTVLAETDTAAVEQTTLRTHRRARRAHPGASATHLLALPAEPGPGTSWVFAGSPANTFGGAVQSTATGQVQWSMRPEGLRSWRAVDRTGLPTSLLLAARHGRLLADGTPLALIHDHQRHLFTGTATVPADQVTDRDLETLWDLISLSGPAEAQGLAEGYVAASL